jgi:hypothetical protein
MIPDRETTEWDLDDAALQEEQLNVPKENSHDLAKKMDCFILEVRNMETVSGFAQEDFDEVSLTGEIFNIITEDAFNVAKEIDSLILQCKHMGKNRGATEKEMDNAEPLKM